MERLAPRSRRPSRESKASRTGGIKAVTLQPMPESWNTAYAVTQPTDEFGLTNTIYNKFPKATRYYVSVALTALNLPTDIPPQAQGFGTIPELCIYGGLLERGYKRSSNGFVDAPGRSFIFQSRLLGGRVPGGAVADFVVFTAGVTIAVRVESIFHSVGQPFGSGGVKIEEDYLQRLRLESAGFIDMVIDVNRASTGFCLENGPDVLVEDDFRRIQSAYEH